MKRKVLLMGKSGSGKTSMRCIIFANYIAGDTRRLGATIDVEHSHVRFMGNLVLNLWDCGGQEAFMESYFTSQKDHIFKNVQVLIYVMDVETKADEDVDRDLNNYQMCIDALKANSPQAKVFVLIHKMDLVNLMDRESTMSMWLNRLKVVDKGDAMYFATSIWDESLYKAWSSIVHSLIPDIDNLQNNLASFCKTCHADEVVLFERTTFLVISHANTREYSDAHRFEKISNIIKQFKLSCTKLQTSFQSMEISNSNYTACVETLTANTFIMVILSDPDVEPAAVKLNIMLARKYFDQLEIVAK
ncbi:hypothetical protein MIR68_007860 [Amoeboaphelidium protococcarum]|nr:hypothetical protein MIR68_007860 [Amoeboaphelidium protococcarum]KAI3642842.1 hypothetical protein MP228_012397 [Amoeboaphelidium protococcarum]